MATAAIQVLQTMTEETWIHANDLQYGIPSIMTSHVMEMPWYLKTMKQITQTLCDHLLPAPFSYLFLFLNQDVWKEIY